MVSGMKFSFCNQIIMINMPTRDGLKDEIRNRFRDGVGFALATVNLDHLVKMRASPDFSRVYAAQDLVVADGWPVAALSRLARTPVELMPGSDLILPLCELAAEEGMPVAFVGSTQAALDDAARALLADVPGLNIVLRIAPPLGFDPHGDEAGAILVRLEAQGVRLCFLAFGAPKQETLALRGRTLAPGVGFASIGAGLDFLGGHQIRAPVWMRRPGLEWLWRVAHDPVRLGPRYLRSFAILPGQAIAALRLRGG